MASSPTLDGSRSALAQSNLSRSAPQLPSLLTKPRDAPDSTKPDAESLARRPQEDLEDRPYRILQGSGLFKEVPPELLSQVLRHCKLVEHVKDVVLFREGDPPSKGYIVASGTLGIYINGNVKSPRKPITDGCKEMKVPPDQKRRVNTAEGWSSFSMKSNLGVCVKKSCEGEVFGNLALTDDSATRKASVKCLSDCVLLCIPLVAFNIVRQFLDEQDEKKRAFLGEHVPGMYNLPIPGPNDPAHPAIYFVEKRVESGHIFLKQGIDEKGVVFVLIKGEVVLSRLNEKQTSAEAAGAKLDDAVFVLTSGAVFGPLPAKAPEPFTVAAATPCVLWCAPGESLGNLPRNVIEGLQAKIASENASRMRHCLVSTPMGWNHQLPAGAGHLFNDTYRQACTYAHQTSF